MSAQSLAISPSARLAPVDADALEPRRARVARRPTPPSAAGRLEALRAAGFNTFLLPKREVYLDMLIDAGPNAASGARMPELPPADGANAGSAGLGRLEAAAREVFGTSFLLPLRRGRAAERVICASFVEPGSVVPMNYHFTTTRAHVERAGGSILELARPEALDPAADLPFKGDLDAERLEAFLAGPGGSRTAFVRMEAAADMLGGQPFSLANLRAVSRAARSRGILLVLDASRLAENALLVRRREPECAALSVAELFRAMADLADIVYFSARRLSASPGGAILTSDPALFAKMRDLVPLSEGFPDCDGLPAPDFEAMAVGLRDSLDEAVIGRSPDLVEHLAGRLHAAGVPVILPTGAFGVHVDAHAFLPGLRAADYPAGALAAAFYLVSGARGMERGGISADRDECGAEVPADMELLGLAFHRRLFSPSRLRYAEDRLEWLFANRGLVGGLRFVEEPAALRFLSGRLDAVGDWPERLVAAFRAEFGEAL